MDISRKKCTNKLLLNSFKEYTKMLQLKNEMIIV